MVEIAIDLDDVDVVLIRWSATDSYLVVRPDGSTSREDSRPGIPVWDVDAASDIDEVIDAAYAAGYACGRASVAPKSVASAPFGGTTIMTRGSANVA